MLESRNAKYPDDSSGEWVENYFLHDARGWWFRTEDEDCLGPFPSLEEARKNLDDYCDYLNNGPKAVSNEVLRV